MIEVLGRLDSPGVGGTDHAGLITEGGVEAGVADRPVFGVAPLADGLWDGSGE